VRLENKGLFCDYSFFTLLKVTQTFNCWNFSTLIRNISCIWCVYFTFVISPSISIKFYFYSFFQRCRCLIIFTCADKDLISTIKCAYFLYLQLISDYYCTCKFCSCKPLTDFKKVVISKTQNFVSILLLNTSVLFSSSFNFPQSLSLSLSHKLQASQNSVLKTWNSSSETWYLSQNLQTQNFVSILLLNTNILSLSSFNFPQNLSLSLSHKLQAY